METLLEFRVRSSFSRAVAKKEMSGRVKAARETWGPAGRDETVLSAASAGLQLIQTRNWISGRRGL